MSKILMDFQMFSFENFYTKSQNIFLSSATKFVRVPRKKQNTKAKVRKWLHWQKFDFECAIDVKGYNNDEAISPRSLDYLHMKLQFWIKHPCFIKLV